MRVASSVLRPLSLAVLAIAVVGVSGCKWFKKDSPEYAMSEETRPLEVPPDLNLPSTAGAMKLPPSVSASQVVSAPVSAASATSFHVVGSRDDVFNRLGVALGEVEGLTIASLALRAAMPESTILDSRLRGNSLPPNVNRGTENLRLLNLS